MFNRRLPKIRGEFIVTTSNDQYLLDDGLQYEISVSTETEFDLDIDLDEDFNVCEKLVVTFRPNRAGWKKAYRRLRQQFKGRIQCFDKRVPPTLATRLRHKKMLEQFHGIKQGATPCA
ncbi:hypothetical protein [Psychromonas sp. MME2]|uniref:hypothetical protein n=1 Tax=unclassified Psychromonas TaxID=2614957 RepID=UPI00339CB4E3